MKVHTKHIVEKPGASDRTQDKPTNDRASVVTRLKLSRNPSAVSDAPDSKCAGEPGRFGGARPIQRFEGSRPWGGDYAYSIVLGLGKKLGEQLVEPARARPGLVW